MQIKYLIRLDDACPTMDAKRWGRMERILDQYGIRPLVGVIPDNRDTLQQIDPPDRDFWDKVRAWQQKGWAIALHGYDHVYVSGKGGMNPVQADTEFAGLPLEKQEEKIAKGMEIFREAGVIPAYFFAPSHTFDRNTLKALKNKSDIRMISDTPAFYPYRREGFVFIPLQFGQFREINMAGMWTFGFHPNVMDEKAFERFESFIRYHRESFMAFDDIDYLHLKGCTLKDRCYALFYYGYRWLKRKI